MKFIRLCLSACLILTSQSVNAMRDLDVYGESIAQHLSIHQKIDESELNYALSLAQKENYQSNVDVNLSEEMQQYKNMISTKLKEDHMQDDLLFFEDFYKKMPEDSGSLVLLQNILNFL